MRRDDLIRIRHMLDAAKEALSFSQNKTRGMPEMTVFFGCRFLFGAFRLPLPAYLVCMVN